MCQHSFKFLMEVKSRLEPIICLLQLTSSSSSSFLRLATPTSHKVDFLARATHPLTVIATNNPLNVALLTVSVTESINIRFTAEAYPVAL